jgi:putative ABC transport system permease protein
VRFVDLVQLSLSALWQQKLRTTLTTLGVIFGSFVLLASLSVRSGVQERIVQEYARFRELREVHVYPLQRVEEEPPQEELEVRGQMSDDKRQRLRAEITRKWQWNHPSKANVRIDERRLGELRELPHVQAVRPHLRFQGRAMLGTDAEYVLGIPAAPGYERLAKRIVAGQYFDSDQGRQVVVSEHLLYILGVADDVEVDQVIGQKLRLELRSNRPSPSFLLTLLLGHGAKAEAKDEELLGKVLKHLPEVVAQIGLSPDEQVALQQLLKQPSAQKDAQPISVAEEFTICGVMKGPPDEEGYGPHRWEEDNADLLLPAGAMAEFLFRVPELRENGYENTVVEVDHIDNVKAVTQQIESMGLMATALIPVIEREQAMYTLIFSAMTIIAITALLVAALGITNTTLMSVLERVREIGIMKAVGARDGHIQAIFLIEGALIGAVGGTMGTLGAWLASYPGDAWVQSLVQRQMSYELHGTIFAFPWPLVVGVPLFATLVTTIAALLPARRAATVNPVAALRHD